MVSPPGDRRNDVSLCSTLSGLAHQHKPDQMFITLVFPSLFSCRAELTFFLLYSTGGTVALISRFLNIFDQHSKYDLSRRVFSLVNTSVLETKSFCAVNFFFLVESKH
ncbi:hypothetical protein BY458DRAFT_76023 [Sporodiniella umbellata]|nr:hypothetical protein BY458DRAFT_76023 [Sporodiniella umbellata]